MILKYHVRLVVSPSWPWRLAIRHVPLALICERCRSFRLDLVVTNGHVWCFDCAQLHHALVSVDNN